MRRATAAKKAEAVFSWRAKYPPHRHINHLFNMLNFAV